ncbi:MAG TPA: DUF3307 domain-containing protein [Parafilimonas sp.]|nr:DUF3307 domain-containing protein [Parafilimonas sp.]
MQILLQWLAVHLLADFALQTKKLVQQKRECKAGSWFLYVHCLLHAGLVYLLSPDKSFWLIPVIIFITHYFIDLWKLYQKDTATFFIIDQLLHITVLVIVWIIFYHPVNDFDITLTRLLQYNNFWLIAVAYLFTIFPLAYLLGYATQRWRKDIEQTSEHSATSLSEAGKWIGIFERILVLTFVVVNHFEGIGFLIAAKSILRFNDIKGDHKHKEAEYVLIGTLMSFASSIVIGILVTLLMK